MPTTLNQWIEFNRSRVLYIYIYIERERERERERLLFKRFSLFEISYPLSWSFLLFVNVVLLLSVDMSQGLIVCRLHEWSSGRVSEERPARPESSYVV